MSTVENRSRRKPSLLSLMVIMWMIASMALVSSESNAAQTIWGFEDTSDSKTYSDVMVSPVWFDEDEIQP